MGEEKHNSLTRGAFWTSVIFYGLIAFEFFYMFSPFAAYLYGVYGPGLELLAFSETTGWLIAFFMPHIVRQTQSMLINGHEAMGMILFIGGLIGFCAGAIQIYRNKLKKGGAVVVGIYRHIRHPQYLALMISSLGMVLIWPRYLVLFGFISVCFTYYLLARLEEKICSRQFPGYDEYLTETGMFLPAGIENKLQLFPWPSKKPARIISTVFLYLFLLFLSFSGATAIHSYSINSLYTWSDPAEVYLSVGRFSVPEFEELIQIADSDSEVQNRLDEVKMSEYRFINYVMPADLLISEVPMFIPEGQTPSHRSPHREDQSRYKIIYTIADFGPSGPVNGKEILRKAINKIPVLEVWIDRNSGQVEQILDPPEADIYKGMPVPVF